MKKLIIVALLRFIPVDIKKIIYFVLFIIRPKINRILNKDKNNKRILIYYSSNLIRSGGLTDKLKGIISAYYLSLLTKREFKIIFNYPFDITKVLNENKINWTIKSKTLESKLLSVAKHYNFLNQSSNEVIKMNIQKIIDDKNKVLVVKINNDYLNFLDNIKINKWAKGFNNLFKYSSFTNNILSPYLKLYNWDRVIGVHCRFINLLGDNFESGKTLNQEYCKALIDKIKFKLHTIINDNGGRNKLFICSDSIKFINNIKNDNLFTDSIIIIDGIPKHSERDILLENDLQKIIIDFFLLAECSSIISIAIDKMYQSGFPNYAARIKNKNIQVLH